MTDSHKVQEPGERDPIRYPRLIFAHRVSDPPLRPSACQEQLCERLVNGRSHHKSPQESGAMKGGSKAALLPFTKPTVAAYRKIAANKDRLQEYYDAIDDVPGQTDFIRWCNGTHVTNNCGETDSPPDCRVLASDDRTR